MPTSGQKDHAQTVSTV